MTIVKVRGIGSAGISEDVPPSELPLSMFSYGEDIVYKDGKLENTPLLDKTLKGVHGEVVWLTLRYNQVTKEPEVVYVGRDANGFDRLYIIKDSNLANTDGTEKGVDASRASAGNPYSIIPSNRFSRWQGFSSNGVVVLTNGSDIPQVLMPDSDTFIDMPNWSVSKRCKSIVAFKGLWVAMNITDQTELSIAQNKTTMVMWSSPLTDIGTVPGSWDPVDQTGAGFNFLADTGGAILSGMALSDTFLIYKTDSVIRMDYTGDATNPFYFRTIFQDRGAWSATSIVPLNDKHLVISSYDVYITDGMTYQSVAQGKALDELSTAIFDNPSTEDIVVAPDYSQKHIGVLVKSNELGQKVTRTYNYNYDNGEWSRRSPVEGYIDYVTFLPLLETNASATPTWDSTAYSWADVDDTLYESQWDSTSVKGLVSRLAVIQGSEMYTYGKFRARTNGTSFTLKKYDIDFDEIQGVDSSVIKSINALYPITTKAKGYLIVKIWGHDKPGEVVPEENKKFYVLNMEEEHRLDMRVSGRYISYEMFTDEDLVANWDGYSFGNYIEKPQNQPEIYIDLTGIDYNLTLNQRR